MADHEQAGADVSDAGSSSAHDLGILLVHGIGNQPYGQTLRVGGDALATWLTMRLGDELFRREERADAGQITLSGTRLSRYVALEKDVPAHSRLEIRPRSGKDEERPAPISRWLLAESWWADSFTAPRWTRLVTWTMVTASATFSGEIAELYDELSLARTARRPLRFLTRLLRLYLYFFFLAPLLILLILLTILSLVPQLRRPVMAVQGILVGSVGDTYALVESDVSRAAIITKTRADLEWLYKQGVARVLVVAHSQGSEVARQALSETALPVPTRLITYGSAIRKLLLLQRLRPRLRFGSLVSTLAVSVLVAAGSGYLAVRAWWQLGAAARSMRDRIFEALPRLPWIDRIAPVALALVVFLVLAAAILGRLHPGDAPDSTPGPAARPERGPGRIETAVYIGSLLVPLAALLLWGALARPNLHAQVFLDIGVIIGQLLLVLVVGTRTTGLVNRYDLNVVDPPRPPGSADVPWLDVVATSDPVAALGLQARGSGKAALVEAQVHNRRSILSDHTSYWQNWGQFVPLVLGQIDGLLSRSAEPDVPPAVAGLRIPRFWQAEQDRLRRRFTAFLLATRAAIILSLFLVVLPTGPVSKPLSTWLKEESPLPDPSIGSWHLHDALPGLLLALAALVVYLGAAFALDSWLRGRRLQALDLLRWYDQAGVEVGAEPDLCVPARFDGQRSLVVQVHGELRVFPLMYDEVSTRVMVFPEPSTAVTGGPWAYRVHAKGGVHRLRFRQRIRLVLSASSSTP